MASDQKTMSLRLPAALHLATRRLAQRRGISLNALIQQSLEALLRDEEEKRFYDSFTLLGEDLEACDVAYAAAAQQEAVLRDRP